MPLVTLSLLDSHEGLMDPEATDPVSLVLDADHRIDDHVHCVACSYNLRGLLPDGRCPECGTPIGRSLHGNLLRFAEPAWVLTLASGMNWIMAGIYVGIPGIIFVSIISAFIGLWPTVLITIIAWAAQIIGLVGCWKVTTPDPGRSDEAGISARRLVRWGFVTYVALGIPAQAISSVHPAITLILTTFQGIPGLVATVALFIYACQLADRIPSPCLRRSTRIVMWGSITVGAVSILSLMASLAVGCLMPLAILVFGLWALRLIHRYREEFRLTALEAQGTWARAAGMSAAPAAG